MGSRGCSFQDLLRGKWLKGPDRLIADESEWPITQLSLDTNTLDNLPSEVRKSETIFETAQLPVRTPGKPLFNIEMSRYSILLQLLRVTATCLYRC